jgi:hypothetical protein
VALSTTPKHSPQVAKATHATRAETSTTHETAKHTRSHLHQLLHHLLHLDELLE